MPMGFGNPAEWERFNAEYPGFVERYEVLLQTIDRFFVRRSEAGDKLDRVVFGLGRVCAEDFQQIVILCGNSFGIGGLQLLRGMYEREVTAAYLSKHPESIDDFIDYHFVHTRKAVNHLKEAYNLDELHKLVPPEKIEEIERNYQSVKARFTEPLCQTCGTTKPMFSWTRYHTGVLAQRGLAGLKGMYFYWYFRPTLLSHSTIASVMARMKILEDDSLFFDGEAQRNYVKEALVGAHHLMLYALDTQNDHFKLSLDDEIRARAEDFDTCWGKADES